MDGKDNSIDGSSSHEGNTSNTTTGSRQRNEARMDRIKAKAKKSAKKNLQVTTDDFDPQVLAEMLGLPVSVFFADQGSQSGETQGSTSTNDN